MVETRRTVKEIADQKKSTLEAADVFYYFTGFHVRNSRSSFREDYMLAIDFI